MSEALRWRALPDVVMKPVGVDMEEKISETVVEEKAAEEAEDDDKPYFDF